MSNPLRVVIVDDEAPARERMVTLLAPHAGVCVVGEAADIDSAADLCRRVSPGVVFLDVQLRGASGFDLLPRLTESPVVVFVTAHHDYAVRAFETNALDYLVKPVHTDRLAAALTRVRAAAAAAVPGVPPIPLPSARLAADDVVALREDGGMRVVPLRRITHIESEENYTRVHVAGEPPAFVRRPMLEWNRLLPGPQFLRVSRSLIVQLAAVREVRTESRDVARVLLKGQPESLTVARRSSMRIRQALESR
jgi:two-component system LytT family response regulator